MRHSRTFITILLIISLLFTSAARWVSDRQRHNILTDYGRQPLSSAGGGNLSGMNSFALALLLGGLRGPLVMILWQQSESQKHERNLEDFDTLVEWIRMLQPEFDSVHIFQIWNKAYNISVQMASLPNKYITILDALDYAYRTDAERPHNINILSALAQVYFEKLGNSAEKAYYRDRIRKESMWREVTPQTESARTVRTNRLEPRLDANGNILAKYLQGNLPRPATLPEDQPWNTGADLQYLEAFQPFPYGISPYAFAYNYHKRAQVLQEVANQRHAQLSDIVISSRPALALKFWAEEEFERSRYLEARMMGVRPYTDAEQEQLKPFGDEVVEAAQQLDILTAKLAPSDQPLSFDGMDEMVYGYGRAAELAEAAIAEYERHLSKREYALNVSTYESHMDDQRCLFWLARADRHYLLGLAAPADSAERREHLQQAAQCYRQAQDYAHLTMLRYYTNNLVLEMMGTDRDRVRNVTPAQRATYVRQAAAAFAAGVPDPHLIDRNEYARYAERSQIRLGYLQQLGIEPSGN